MNDKTRYINLALWAAYLLALLSSISHLAWTFGTVEHYPALGWLSAVAVDAGLAALAYTIQQRKRAKKPVGDLWAGLAFFALISATANFYHALAVESGGGATLLSLKSLDWLALAKAALLSASLPGMVVYLGEVVSGDDALAAAALQKNSDREAAKAEREQRRLDLQAEREVAEAKAALLQAENERKRLELQAEQAEDISLTAGTSETQANQERHACAECGYEAKSKNALNAHKRKHLAIEATVAVPAMPLNGKAH